MTDHKLIEVEIVTPNNDSDCHCLICPLCGAHERGDCIHNPPQHYATVAPDEVERYPFGKWNISAFKVDRWSRCNACRGAYFNYPPDSIWEIELEYSTQAEPPQNWTLRADTHTRDSDYLFGTFVTDGSSMQFTLPRIQVINIVRYGVSPNDIVTEE